MKRKHEGKPKDPEALGVGLSFADDEGEPVGEEVAGEEFEPGSDPDAEAMAVSLQAAKHAGVDCVEVFAHGEASPDEDSAKKVQRRVLLARVTESALAMFPLVFASYRPAFLAPKYGELTTITISADEDESIAS